MNIAIKCPDCGKRVFEGEVFYEEGEKYVEIACFSCSWVTYKVYSEWKQKLAQAIKRQALHNASRG